MDGAPYPLEDLGDDTPGRIVDAPFADAAEPTILGSTDGRSLRRERNRDAVIDALLELIREGNFEPNTSEIAERAGVSHRSVFRYFDDLSDLVRTTIDHAIAQVLPLAYIPDVGQGPVEHRIDNFLDAVFRVYNHTHEIGRVARARSLAIKAIDDGLMSVVQMFREQIADQFAPELEALDQPARDDLLDALQVIVSFESFDLCRRRLGRRDEEIRRAWRSALAALLAS